VLGPPGSDRESIVDLIATWLGVPAIRSSDILEAEVRANTPAGRQAKGHMEAGELLPEPLVLAMVRDRLAQPDVAAGFVLDGFPNQAVRAAMLDAVLSDLAAPIDRVVDLVLTDDEVVRRLSGRRVCRDCGKVWHLEFSPPARPEVCDTCGGALFQRYDDGVERVIAGLRSFRSAVAPVLEHYRSLGTLVPIDATMPQPEIAEAAIALSATSNPEPPDYRQRGC
jgi:adenylate kinase